MNGDGSPAERLIDETLDVLFLTYGVRAERSGRGFRVPSRPGLTLWGEASCPAGSHVVQLDVLLRLPDGRTVCESCGGLFGEAPKALLSDALAAMAEGTFPVLISAFFGQPPERGASHVRWPIGGVPREVFVGPMTYRYGAPGGVDGADAFAYRLFEWVQDWLGRSSLPPGDHWVRVYHQHRDGRAFGNEVLLDNVPWPEAEAELAHLDWPAGPDPSDARVFLVVRDLAE